MQNALNLSPGDPPPPQVSVEMFGGHLILDIVRLPPGTSGVQETEGFQHTVGEVGHYVGLGINVLEAVGIAWDFPIPGEEDAGAFVDILAEGLGSWGRGESYFGQPHPSLPPMLVIGQDVWVAGFDFGLAGVSKIVGGAVALLPGIAVAEVVDGVTTGASIVYDYSRVRGGTPTLGAIGFYYAEGAFHIVVLDYTLTEQSAPQHH